MKNDDTTAAVTPQPVGRGAAFAKVHLQGPPDNAQPRPANLYPCPSCCDHKWEYELSMWHPKGLSGAAASAGCWNASGPGCRISDASGGSECLDATQSDVFFTACQGSGPSGGIPGQHFLFLNSSDNTTMAIRTADGRSCLSWRSSSTGPDNSAGAQVVAQPCDATESGQQWRFSTAEVPEDSAHTFLTPHGHCVHAAPYAEGNIRYEGAQK